MIEQLVEIGNRIAGLRDLCGFTDEEVAKKLGMSVEEYLTYESGECDFSYSTLYNLAALFEVDVLSIIRGESPKLTNFSIVRKDKGFHIKRDDAYEYKLLAYTFKDKKANPMLVTASPKHTSPVLHTHAGQEFNYVVAGKIKLYLGDMITELEEGDSAYFDSTIPHTQIAVGETDGKYIAIVIEE